MTRRNTRKIRTNRTSETATTPLNITYRTPSLVGGLPVARANLSASRRGELRGSRLLQPRALRTPGGTREASCASQLLLALLHNNLQVTSSDSLSHSQQVKKFYSDTATDRFPSKNEIVSKLRNTIWATGRARE